MHSSDVRRQWADRSGEYSPAYYAHYGPDETSEALRETFERHLDDDARVLELGCSSGRHLSHLHDHGFGNLAGIELNEAAFDVMAETYPALADAGRFHPVPIEDVVETFADGAFDVVYSVETLQHVHPDAAWVFAELARITDSLLVTVENEGEGDGDVSYVRDDIPLYHRDWGAVFRNLGLVQHRATDLDRDTMRVFKTEQS